MTAVTVWPKPDIAVTKRWQVYSTKCDFFCSSKSSSQTRLKTKETNAQKSPTDEEAYGPGFVQRLRRRFLTNTDHSQCIIQTAPLQCQRGKVQIDAIVAKPQLDRYETFTKAMPDNKRPQTTVNLSSVHKLKQKFESLSANESTCHHHIQHQPVSNKHCSKLFKDYCTPPPPTTTDNFSNNKKPISKKSEKMTTTTTTVSNAGYAEMTALLEKFRRNRELKEQQTSLHSKMDLRNEMNNKSEHANEMIDSNYQYPISPVGISLSKKWQHVRSPSYNINGRSQCKTTALKKSSSRASPLSSKLLDFDETHSNDENGAVATPRTLAELRQVATVVASYVNMPTSTLNGNGRPCLLIESASECSSAESDDVSKNYEFDGAYVIPRKSSLCSGTRASKLKDTLVGFSEEPPVAYVYLEETEAENFGLWTAGADISMDLYFCIKEQMRKERENSQDISQLSERN
ncbi:hypothetical protein T4A_3630 [Trichinella pseudospiralis]|uniref:Uncharacterized protein n=1 Tax=Trichinella pseudospiralis TaxID=6337 RepID=A0A0V1J6M7_TRIPS|nr:hypothetical protein T4A_3630 [Trichinella pseudospiralis]KRZ30647.1 hypothetical protein T4C_3139 [Trichinella pseudospiralis]